MVIANGHKLTGDLAILEKLVDGGELPYAYSVVLEFPRSLRGKLLELGFIGWCIIGLLTLELLQLTPNAVTGTLCRTAALLI